MSMLKCMILIPFLTFISFSYSKDNEFLAGDDVIVPAVMEKAKFKRVKKKLAEGIENVKDINYQMSKSEQYFTTVSIDPITSEYTVESFSSDGKKRVKFNNKNKFGVVNAAVSDSGDFIVNYNKNGNYDRKYMGLLDEKGDIAYEKEFSGHSMLISPSGRFAATAGSILFEGGGGALSLIDLKTKTEIEVSEINGHSFFAAKFYRDDKLLIITDNEKGQACYTIFDPKSKMLVKSETIRNDSGVALSNYELDNRVIASPDLDFLSVRMIDPSFNKDAMQPISLACFPLNLPYRILTTGGGIYSVRVPSNKHILLVDFQMLPPIPGNKSYADRSYKQFAEYKKCYIKVVDTRSFNVISSFNLSSEDYLFNAVSEDNVITFQFYRDVDVLYHYNIMNQRLSVNKTEHRLIFNVGGNQVRFDDSLKQVNLYE